MGTKMINRERHTYGSWAARYSMLVTVGSLNVAFRTCAGHCVFTVLTIQKAAVPWLAVCRFEHVQTANVFRRD